MYFKTQEKLIPFKKVRAFSLSGQSGLLIALFLQTFNTRQTEVVIIQEI